MPLIQPDNAAYARMMALMFPPGRIRTDATSNIYRVFRGASDELVRVGGRILDLFRERDPAQTVELLPEFEEMLDLVAEGTETERRNRVIAALLRRPRFRPEDFRVALAPLLGMAADDIPVIETSRALTVLVGDDREIYRWFIYRDPTLPNAYDLDSAQTLADSMSPTHTKVYLIESIAAECDDPYSLCDRDLLGGDAVDVFQIATSEVAPTPAGLSPNYVWPGDEVDLVAGETLESVIGGVGGVDDQVAVDGLRVRNGFSNVALSIPGDVNDGWELEDAATFDFDPVNGPSWMFVMVFATTGGLPPATRNLYGDRDNLGNGAEITMATNGSLTWAVNAGFRTLNANYADNRIHVIAFRWRYDTGAMQIASETQASTTATALANVSSTMRATFGRGRLPALGCKIPFIAAVSGEQTHDVDLLALAQRIHGIMTPDITV